MSIINDITADNRIATAVVAALENALGGDLILGVGRPRTEAPTADVMPTPPARVVRIALTQGATGGEKRSVRPKRLPDAKHVELVPRAIGWRGRSEKAIACLDIPDGAVIDEVRVVVRVIPRTGNHQHLAGA